MSNKENISTNKSEGPTLKMEPVQMKKKKKAGGYNLRKSIAWNRAFFTEEGVLDPEELSLISGTLVSSSGEGLSTINEEAMDSLVEDYQFINDTANLQALEKNLFKGAPSACSQEKGEISYLPLKHTSPARSSQASTSMENGKFLSTHGAKRSGSKSGASRSSLPPLSLKRPANTNASKPVSEESKLPKVPVSKPRHLSLLATSKSTVRGTASLMKNQILQPVVNKQRNTEPKSYIKSVNIPKSKAKDVSESLPVRSSSFHAKRNKVNPPSMPAPIPLSSSEVKKVGNSGPKVIQEDGPCTVKANLSEDHITAQVGNPLHSNSLVTDTALQHTKIQSNKPSGLRMPSPSLGFFDQSKVAASNRSSRRVVEPNPRVGKLSDRRPPAKVPQVLNSNVLTANSLISSLTYAVDALSNTPITPDVGEDSRENRKQLLDNNDRFGHVGEEQTMTCITGSEEKFQHHDKNELSLIPEDKGVEMNDCEMLLVTEQCEHFSEDGNANNSNLGDRASEEFPGSKDSRILSQTNFVQSTMDVAGTSTIKSPCTEESSNSAVTGHDVAIESQNGDMSNSKMLHSSMLRSDVVCYAPDLHHPSHYISDDLEASASEKHAVPDVCNPPLLEEGSTKLIGYSHSSASEVIGEENLKNVEPNKFVLEDSHFSSEYMHESQSEDSAIKDDMTDSSDVQETQLTLVANGSEDSLDQSLETGGLSNPSGTLVELQTARFNTEPISNNMRGSTNAECKLPEKDTDTEEYQKYGIETTPLVLSDKIDTSEIDDSGILTSDAIDGLIGDGFCTNKKAGLDYSELNSVQAVHPVVDQKCLLHRNASSVAYLSDEPGFKDLLSCSPKVPEMEDNMTLTILEPACQDLFGGSYLENQGADTSQTSLSLESKVFNEVRRCDFQSAAETDPTFHDCSPTELGRKRRLPQVLNDMEKVQMDSVNMGNFSQTGDDDDLEHVTGDHDPILTVISNQFAEGTNFAVESGQLELPSCCILVKEIPEDKNKLLLGNCPNEERAEAESSEESIGQSDIGSSKAIGNAVHKSLPAQGNKDDENESYEEGPCIEDLRSRCIHVQTSVEQNQFLSGCQLRQGAEFREHEVCQNTTDGLFGDTKCDFVPWCQETDEKDTGEIGRKKSMSTSNKRNLAIVPPRNAVPFSDEWLAAIEAAGEEILTMKSGAVQNSPPDKSLPEPSPWSPVKRKNNAIGPYDCTKFTNN